MYVNNRALSSWYKIQYIRIEVTNNGVDLLKYTSSFISLNTKAVR